MCFGNLLIREWCAARGFSLFLVEWADGEVDVVRGRVFLMFSKDCDCRWFIFV